MDKPTFKLVGSPCGHHGQYTFYKALRITGETERILAIGDFFFVRIWQDSELVSIGELQLLWTDRVSDQTLVSLRLYFLPENTPDGRNQHGEDEVLAINDKVVVRAEDLLSWMCRGEGWRWGLRAVWRGACAPPADPKRTQPLHHTRLDFTDVEKEKNAIAIDAESPGVVVFSYPRYCRYRALVARLEGIQADWLRDSLVAALGGYAAPTKNTSILYCKDTFEYPELEGHEFVCNHLAPRLKGRPRGRRRRVARSRSHSPSSRSSDSDPGVTHPHTPQDPNTPRRLSLRNGAPEKHSEEEEAEDGKKVEQSTEDEAFLVQLKQFYKDRNETMKIGTHSLKDLSLRALYNGVCARGGYEAVCRHKLWRVLFAEQSARTRRHYERFLLRFENHERRKGITLKPNGYIENQPIDTIDVSDSPLRQVDNPAELPEKRLRTPSPKREVVDNETGETKEDINTVSKPAEELNREFLDSLSKQEKAEKPLKISVKPVEKLLGDVAKSDSVKSDTPKDLSANTGHVFFSELAHKLNLGNTDASSLKDIADRQRVGIEPATLNGHTTTLTPLDQKDNRPAGRSSLRAVRVKPARQPGTASNTPAPIPPLHPDSASSPLTSGASTLSAPPPAPVPPITNFGIHHPPQVTSTNNHSDDEIVEVPYKPKSPEIIDLDEYPESPQAMKKKRLDLLKERGLEVTALPPAQYLPQPVLPNPITPILTPNQMLLNPAMQHQIMTQAQLFQMYNIIPPNYNGIQPPKVIQATCIYGNTGPEKTVYGNPKDPFMPPPHVLHGAPVKPARVPSQTQSTPAQDILDLTCKTQSPAVQKPAVEIVRIPSSPSPSKNPQNLAKNYTLIDGKAVVGSNLEITLVNKTQPVQKNRIPQKRSSNGKFVSTKTPTPPKEYPKSYTSPKNPANPAHPPIVVPSYPSRDNASPTSSTGSRDSQNNLSFKPSADSMPKMPMPYMDPYMALYSQLAGQMDQRQLAIYRDLMANQFRGYSNFFNMGTVSTPTTKN